jgi:nitrogen regulatory protein P-II 1
MRFKIIVAMVKTDLTARIVDAAKAAGGTGATIVPAHGTGIREAKTFFGLTLDAQTDAIFFLLEENLVEKVMKAISEEGRFREPGTGIAFVLPVEQVAGLESQIEYFEKELENLTETV